MTIPDRVVLLFGPVSVAYALQSGSGVYSFVLRVADLDAALASLDLEGVKTVYRTEGLAATDPATTLGPRLEWSQ